MDAQLDAATAQEVQRLRGLADAFKSGETTALQQGHDLDTALDLGLVTPDEVLAAIYVNRQRDTERWERNRPAFEADVRSLIAERSAQSEAILHAYRRMTPTRYKPAARTMSRSPVRSRGTSRRPATRRVRAHSPPRAGVRPRSADEPELAGLRPRVAL